MQLKKDEQADKAFGWVLEMWSFTIACARRGIRFRIEPRLQVEPRGAGVPSSWPWPFGGAHGGGGGGGHGGGGAGHGGGHELSHELSHFYIYHYTFGLDVPPSSSWWRGGGGSGGAWSWWKRSFLHSYPEPLTPPPAHAPQSTHDFVRLMNAGLQEGRLRGANASSRARRRRRAAVR